MCSELAPPSWRGRLVACMQMAVNVGESGSALLAACSCAAEAVLVIIGPFARSKPALAPLSPLLCAPFPNIAGMILATLLVMLLENTMSTCECSRLGRLLLHLSKDTALLLLEQCAAHCLLSLCPTVLLAHAHLELL